MMELFFFIVAALALLHFWYESILAPSLRWQVRHELFKLRDEVRSMKIDTGVAFENHHYQSLQHSLNGVIANLYRIDLAMLLGLVKRVHSDEKFKKEMEKRGKVPDDFKLPRAREIAKDGTKLIRAAVSINTGGWSFYIVPIVIAVACYQTTKKVVQFIFSLTESEIEKAVKSPIPTGVVR